MIIISIRRSNPPIAATMNIHMLFPELKTVPGVKRRAEVRTCKRKTAIITIDSDTFLNYRSRHGLQSLAVQYIQ